MNKLKWLRVLIVAFIIGAMVLPSLPVTHISIPSPNISLPKIDIPWSIAENQIETIREWTNSRLSDASQFIAENFSIGPQPVEADSANLYAVVGQATAASGTATVTGSPARFTTAGGTITVTTSTTSQTFTVTCAAGTTATVTSGTATISGSPKACTVGAATTITVTNTITNGSCTIAVTYGSTGLWSSQYSWAASSGGTPGSHAVPTSTNNVYFDANSFGGSGETFTNDSAGQACANLDWSAVSNNPTWAGTTTLSVYGSYAGSASFTRSYSGAITWASTAAGKTITSSSMTWGNAMTFNGASGGWQLQDALNVGTNTITLTNGTLDTNGQTVTSGTFTNATGTSALTLGTTVWNCSGNWGLASATTTLTPGTSSIRLTGTSAAFTGNGKTYYELQENGQTETMSGANTFTNLTCTGASIANDTRTTDSNITVTGTLTLAGSSASNRLAFESSSAVLHTVTSAANTFSNIDFFYVNGAGSANWNVTAISGGSADMGGNSNMTFTDISYWVGGTGHWDTNASTHWSGTSGGTPNSDWEPTMSNFVSVTFDVNSFTAGSNIVYLPAFNVVVNNMDWSAATYSPVVSPNGNYIITSKGNCALNANLSWTSVYATQFNMCFNTSGTTTLTMNGCAFSATNEAYQIGQSGGTVNVVGNINAAYITTLAGNVQMGSYNLTTTSNVANLSITGGAINNINYSLGGGNMYLTLSGVTINGNVTYGGGSGSMSVTNTTIAGSFTCSGSTTMTMTGSTFGSFITSGTSSYTGAFTVTGTATIIGPTIFNNAVTCANMSFTPGASQGNYLAFATDETVTGTFTAAGYSQAYRALIKSTTQGTAHTINAATVSVSNCDLSDVTGGFGNWNISAGINGDAGGNINITFTTAATLYWVAGGGQWTDPLHWSASSGGTTGARIPLLQDTAVFDSNSVLAPGQTIILTAGVRFGNINTYSVTNTPNFSATTADFYGSVTLRSVTWSVTTTDMFGRGTATLTTNGVAIASLVIGQGTTNGALLLGSDLVCTGNISHNAGIFNTGNFNITAPRYTYGASTFARTFVMGSSIITLTMQGTASWGVSSTNFTLVCGTSTIVFSSAGSSSMTFTGAGLTYYNLVIKGSGNYTVAFSEADIFNSITVDRTQAAKTLSGNYAQTINSLLIPVSGTTVATITNPDFTCATGVIVSDYLSLTGSVASGGATFYAGSHSTNVSGNSGWLFSDPSGPFPTATTVAANGLTTIGATLNGTLTNLGSYTSVYGYFQFDQTGTFSYPTSTTLQPLSANGAFSQSITGLAFNNLYYFRAVVVYNGSTYSYGSALTFTTTGAPTLSTGTAANVSTTSATLQGSITGLGSYSNVSVYFEYGTDTNYGTTTAQQPFTVASSFLQNITGLQFNTLYHFRADLVYSGGTIINGSDATFTTLSLTVPSIITLPAASITSTSATLQGQVASMGSYSTVAVFFEYGKTTNYGTTTPDTNTNMVDIIGYQIPNTLAASTTYHYRANLRYNSGAVLNGSDQSFTTAAAGVPTVSTNVATNITATSVTLTATLTSLGNYSSVYVYFEYGTTTGYGSTPGYQAETATGTFSQDVSTGLSSGTLYHYRADVYYGSGSVINGTDQTFTTLPLSLPTVTALTPTGVANSSMTLQGSLTGLGNSIVTIEGFVWSTASKSTPGNVAPTSSGYAGYYTNTGSFSNTGTFSYIATGLNANQIYYIRSVAYNPSGWAYSTEISQITSNATPLPTAYFAIYAGPITAPTSTPSAYAPINMGSSAMPSQFYTEGDTSGIPGASAIHAIFGYSSTPDALWWFPFIYGIIAILSLLFYELTTSKGTVEGSLLSQFIVIEAMLVFFGVLGTAGVSGLIPLYGAFLFPIPAIAIIMSKKHYGWG